MAKPGLSQINTTQTFQTWLDRTNQVVDIIASDAITASSLGDTTTGNATLVGAFTSNTLTAINELRTSDIFPKPGSSTISLNSSISIVSNVQNAQIISSNAGARTVYRSSDIVSGAGWKIGFENSAADSNFIIDSGTGPRKFSLSPSGNLSISGSINITGGGIITADLTGNVTGTVSSISNHTTNNLLEGSNNLYFTTTRARGAFIGGTGVTLNNGNISIGQAVATTSNVTFNNITTAGKANINGNIAIRNSSPTLFLRDTDQNSAMLRVNSNIFYVLRGGNDTETFTQVTAPGAPVAAWPMELNLTNNQANFGGNLFAIGDITAFSSSSDINRKENIEIIPNALEKVCKIGGYTFNFKGDARKLTGVIAQEIEAVLPEVVYDVTDDNTGEVSKAVRYGNIVGLLIEAIKDLKVEINELKNAR